jgi:hypothetical protein
MGEKPNLCWLFHHHQALARAILGNMYQQTPLLSHLYLHFREVGRGEEEEESPNTYKGEKRLLVVEKKINVF